MPDDENEHAPQPPHFQSIEEVRQYQIMHMQKNAHDTLEVLGTMDEDQLRTVRGLLIAVFDDAHINGYFSGVVSSMMEEKFNVCRGCGVNHDEVPEAWSENSQSKEASPLQDTERTALMEEYGVEPDSNGPSDQVRCVELWVRVY